MSPHRCLVPDLAPFFTRQRSRLILASVSLALLLCTGCYVDGGGYGPLPLAISPQVKGVAAGTSQTFTVTSPSGAFDVNKAVWNFNTDPAVSGFFTPASGTTVTYTAPATPPVNPNEIDSRGQGTVVLRALVPGQGAETIDFHITAPTITTGLQPSNVLVPLGSTYQFYGYAVGSTDSTVVWQVNGVAGGNAELGTISNIGGYAAPATLPATGANLTLTVTSHADPTRSSSAAILLK